MPIEKPKIEKPKIDKSHIERTAKRMKAAASRKTNAPAGMEEPDFWGFLDDADIGNPIEGMPLSDDLEDNATREVGIISEALQKIRDEKAERRRKYAMLVDASYYCCVCFQTVDQKIAFMKALGWDEIDGNYQGMYLNGLEIADMMGIEIEPVYIPKKDPPKAPVGLRGKKIIIKGGE